MRKVGERNGNGDNGEYQVAMDLRRRGQPELGGWVSEAERLAGSGIASRGGSSARALVTEGAGGLSPETIANQKAQMQAMYSGSAIQGVGDVRKVNRWAKDKGWTPLLEDPERILDFEPSGLARGAGEAFSMVFPSIVEKAVNAAQQVTGNPAIAQHVKERMQTIEKYMEEAPGNTYFRKYINAIRRANREGRGGKSLTGFPMLDPQGNYHEIPISGGDDENR
jgi:hypothetical protein